MSARRSPIYAADIRQLGGIVTIAPGRDRVTSEPRYTVNHVSAGGDIAFTSLPISDEARAIEAAEVLAQFTGATVQRC
jgi:hypothetical protein